MKRLLSSDLCIPFECDLLHDNLIEIAQRCDCITRCLLRNTCKTLHTSLTAPALFSPGGSPLKAFLHSLAHAPIPIIREAEHMFFCGFDKMKCFDTFLQCIGLECDESRLLLIFPFFAYLDVFTQAQYFLGRLQRLGFAEATLTYAYTYSLSQCVRDYGEVEEIEDDDDYAHITSFITQALEALIEEPNATVADIGEHILRFFNHIGALVKGDRKVYSFMRNISVHILASVLVKYDQRGVEIALGLVPGAWRQAVVGCLTERIEWQDEEV